MGHGTWDMGHGKLTLRRLKYIIDPTSLCNLRRSHSIYGIVESQLARHGNGDFGRRKVARVRNVHVAVFHAELDTGLVVVGKNPDGCDYADKARLVVRHTLTHYGDAACIGDVHHFHVLRIVAVDAMRVLDGLTAAGQSGQLSKSPKQCPFLASTKSAKHPSPSSWLAYTSQSMAELRKASFRNAVV